MAVQTLPPDYFRVAAEKYAANPTDRKAWLTDQVARAKQSLAGYQVELFDIYQEAKKAGAVFDETGAVTGFNPTGGESAVLGTAGVVIAAIPIGATQVIGGAMILASSFFFKAENKQGATRIREILEVAAEKATQAQKVGGYYTAYNRELTIRKILPVAAMGLIIWIITKN